MARTLEQFLINKNFDNLCMTGNLPEIDRFAKDNSKHLTMEGNRDNDKPLFYRLAQDSKLDVIKYLFKTPHIYGVPETYFWDLQNYEYRSGLDMLYKNGNKDFIKELLTNKTLKDNVKINQTFTNKVANKLIHGNYSDFLELVLSKRDWEFADYLLNCPDIKYPILKNFSVAKHALENVQNVNHEFIYEFVNITRDIFKKNSLLSFYGLSSKEVANNMTSDIQLEFIKKALDLNLLDTQLIIADVEKKSKDSSWIEENQIVVSAYKILLNYDMQKNLPKEDKPNRKPKI